MCMQQVMCAHQNGPNSLPCGSRWAPVGARGPQQFDLTLCVCVCVCVCVAKMRLWTQARQMGAYAARCMVAHSSEHNVYVAMSSCLWLWLHDYIILSAIHFILYPGGPINSFISPFLFIQGVKKYRWISVSSCLLTPPSSLASK